MSLRDLLPSREGVQQIPLGLGFGRNKIVSIYIPDKRRLLKKPVTHNLFISWKTSPSYKITNQGKQRKHWCSQSYRSFEAMKNSTLRGCYPEHSNFLEWFGRNFRIWTRKITTITRMDWAPAVSQTLFWNWKGHGKTEMPSSWGKNNKATCMSHSGRRVDVTPKDLIT